ncbi:putative ACR protein [Cronobacter dublinensis 1210]|uniref:ACR protein n=1 Tax=Cronobacter dublinensis 1210 TaxID=1208656 RepID=A0ABP1WGD1_9ENTR|nr:putative ACR protein [Cronobacter dublinensis 1210]
MQNLRRRARRERLPLVEGVEIGTLVELAQWTLEADKVLTF